VTNPAPAARYTVRAVIRTDHAPGARRWQVLEVLDTTYLVRALYSPNGEPTIGSWPRDLCEAATILEWVPPTESEGFFDANGIGHFC